ncbi:MAG TPA: NADPH-dependent 7-cyano-7-deazaguanine reductase QueF [Xanthomonadaceae bacterium]|nr:NADPH-dependent 7-cyano-7-deazaguanine reductase QueF [Xanthomonadaceae bacterium]
MTTPEQSPLGKTVAWPDTYDASLLFPVARASGRDVLGLRNDLPFAGFDLWTAYELGWLDTLGKPRVGIAEFQVPSDSPNLIESKSLKLYLNGLAQVRFDSEDALRRRIARDLGTAAGAATTVTMLPATGVLPVHELGGTSIDEIALEIASYGPPDPAYLTSEVELADEALVSHLFRSNCPVTGQPDWASVQVRYRGPRIDRAGLLRYLVSFRTHSGFHEQCVERIFLDVLAGCRPDALSVYARFTRRGGLDINPWRATPGYAAPPATRGARQ